jgi:hypothetical protein
LQFFVEVLSMATRKPKNPQKIQPRKLAAVQPKIETSKLEGHNNGSSVSSSSTFPDPEQIRRRAYELFLERGASHGNDWNDWFRAEAELTRATPALG